MQVMEIWTGDVYYPRCQEAVGYILTAKSERQAVVTGYKECTQQGFSEGSAGFSSCTEDFKSKAPAPVPLAIAYPGGPDTEPGIRFDYVSPKIQLNREQYACGQLGFLPGSGPYGDCVASLEDALIPNKY
ncbi:MAG TPA: hypothetical protein VN175_09015 [Rhizomicrobium sp.]|nr:hypothetical protein [Rhizomicrobium sp.]